MLVDRGENKVTLIELIQYDFAAAYPDTSILPFLLMGMQHESQPWTKTDIPFDWLESFLFISGKEKYMILTPTSDSGRKPTSPKVHTRFAFQSAQQ
jgi:hypothetical protein